MANQNDSFIDEVTDELRRDKLFGMFRRYGWIAGVVIVAIVGGAVWREYTLSREISKAQQWGDSVIAAEATGDAAALGGIDPLGSADRQVLAEQLSANASIVADEAEAAENSLKAAVDSDLADPVLREMAQLKQVILLDTAMDPAERDQILTHLSRAGAPFELLALEQKAVALIGAGRDEDAVTLIRQILQKSGVTQIMRQRLLGILTTLGADIEENAALQTE